MVIRFLSNCQKIADDIIYSALILFGELRLPVADHDVACGCVVIDRVSVDLENSKRSVHIGFYYNRVCVLAEKFGVSEDLSQHGLMLIRQGTARREVVG